MDSCRPVNRRYLLWIKLLPLNVTVKYGAQTFTTFGINCFVFEGVFLYITKNTGITMMFCVHRRRWSGGWSTKNKGIIIGAPGDGHGNVRKRRIVIFHEYRYSYLFCGVVRLILRYCRAKHVKRRKKFDGKTLKKKTEENPSVLREERTNSARHVPGRSRLW